MSLDQFIAAIGNIPHTSDRAQIRRKSRDMTHSFSPILKEETKDKLADLIVTPQTKDDALKVASEAAKHRIPVLARGAGTGNWGQGIPLAGGVVLDMTALTRIHDVAGRTIRAEPGAIVEAVDRKAQETGQELRMHPSTRRTATIGGYIAGGHVGIGSCTWGILRDRGNVTGVEVVSLEETPRVVELRGDDVNFVHHAYGTNGIITEVEMPLTTAYAWREAIVDFEDFGRAARFAVTLNASDGIVVKLVSINAWPFPKFFRALEDYIRPDRHTVHVMIADDFSEAFDAIVAEFGGTITYQGLEGQGDFGRPLYEFSFGHARMHANSVDPDLVANIGLFPHDDLIGSIERVHARFKDTGPGIHLDMKRIDGNLTCQGYPIFKWQGAEHLSEMVAAFEAEGVRSANTHALNVKDNGLKPIDERELAFKRSMDPLGLLNPGKFSDDEKDSPAKATGLRTKGWEYRKTA